MRYDTQLCQQGNVITAMQISCHHSKWPTCGFTQYELPVDRELGHANHCMSQMIFVNQK